MSGNNVRSRSQRLARTGLLACLVAALAPLAAQTTGRFMTVAPGVRLFVHEEGRGTPVIVIHGGPGLHSRSLAADLEPLARHHRLVFYDQRGSGRSTLSRGVTADVMVRDLEALRRRLGLAKVTLLGHSWGAGLAALYASAHPTLVSRLVLVSSMPLRAVTLDVMEHTLLSRLTADENGRLRGVVRARMNATTGEEGVSACREYWAILLKAYYADPAAAARSRGEACAGSGAALSNGIRVNQSVLEGLGHFDWTSKMSQLRMPTLIIHGDADPLPVESAFEWARTVPGSRLLVLSKSGHAPFVEQPDKFFQAVDQFLDGQWPPEAR
jgi:proline iminopeptidase